MSDFLACLPRNRARAEFYYEASDSWDSPYQAYRLQQAYFCFLSKHTYLPTRTLLLENYY